MGCTLGGLDLGVLSGREAGVPGTGLEEGTLEGSRNTVGVSWWGRREQKEQPG